MFSLAKFSQYRARVLPISPCTPEGWRWRLIVLEKFNFDDADGRPNSERRIGIQAKDLTYHSPLSRRLRFDQNCQGTATTIDILAFREALLSREFKNLKTFTSISLDRDNMSGSRHDPDPGVRHLRAAAD